MTLTTTFTRVLRSYLLRTGEGCLPQSAREWHVGLVDVTFLYVVGDAVPSYAHSQGTVHAAS